MRCPYCQQNIRVQGRFCPKCGEQIFGLPARPPQPGATPGGAAAPAPGAPPAEEGRGTSPRPTTPPAAPAPPPYQPFAPQQPHGDYDDGLGIEVEPEPPPAAPPVGSPPAGPPGASHPAAREEIGKTCPYCRFPLKPSEQVVTCPACKLPHHADCWAENRGCTTYGCRGGAETGGAASPTGYGARPPVVPSTLSPTGGQLPGVDYLRTNELGGRAQNALILAIVGLFCLCLPVGIVGMFMGIAVLRDVGSAGSRSGDARGKAVAAVIIGVVAVVGWIVYFAISMAQSS